MPLPVILDCDTGTDDAVAILCAVLDPRVQLLGVSTVWGNHDVADTTDNTLRVLDLVGAAVPVFSGLNGPYAGRVTPLPSGRDDIPSTLELPASASAPLDEHAPEWIARTVAQRPGEVVIVTTGPLSNLAAAVAEHPGLVQETRAVIALAGTERQEGVAPLVERNVWCDPEAAQRVLGAGFRDLTMVTMEATFSAPLDVDDAASLRGSVAGDAAARFQEQRIGWYAGPAPLHDPLALAAALEPALLTTRRANVSVELEGGPTYGRTHFDWSGTSVNVATAADHGMYVSWLRRVLRADPRACRG
jgi:inosine-uridine nucleoside N-ribohydrolase